MGPCVFLLEHLFCLSHHKTCWTMSMDNVDNADNVESNKSYVGLSKYYKHFGHPW